MPTDAGDEEFPDAGGAQRAHRVAGPDQWSKSPVTRTPRALGPTPRRRCRDRAARCVVAPDVGAEDAPQVLVPALADQVQVHLAEGRQPAVGIVDGVGVLTTGAVGVGDLDAVVAGAAAGSPRKQYGTQVRRPAKKKKECIAKNPYSERSANQRISKKGLGPFWKCRRISRTDDVAILVGDRWDWEGQREHEKRLA